MGTAIAAIIAAIIGAGVTIGTTAAQNKKMEEAKREQKDLYDKEQKMGLTKWQQEMDLNRDQAKASMMGASASKMNAETNKQQLAQQQAQWNAEQSYTRLQQGAQYFKELLGANVSLRNQLAQVGRRRAY